MKPSDAKRDRLKDIESAKKKSGRLFPEDIWLITRVKHLTEALRQIQVREKFMGDFGGSFEIARKALADETGDE